MTDPMVSSVIAAAYRLDADDDAWLQALSDVLAPGLDQGLGLVGYAFDFRDRARPRIQPTVAHGAAAAWTQSALLAHLSMPFEERSAIYRGGPCATGGETVSASGRTGWAAWSSEGPPGARDFVALIATSDEPAGCAFVAPSRQRAVISPEQRATFGQIAAHIVGARQLRERLGDDIAQLTSNPSAAFGPTLGGDGLASSVREALRRAVRTVDGQLGPLGAQPTERASLWPELLAGQWSLVDRFDAEGRHYYIAVRNIPGSVERKPLTPFECSVVGHVALGRPYKAVAYDLGTSLSRVAAAASRACRKLGVRNRMDLTLLLQAAGPDAGASAKG